MVDYNRNPSGRGFVPGWKAGRRGTQQRPDPTKCRSGKHDWIPENIRQRPNQWGYMHNGCNLCVLERARRTSERMLADDPVARKNPERMPQRKGAAVVEDYQELRWLGYSFKEAAVKMNMKREALARALQRAGVPR